ncbi:hypothetical protein J2Y69_003119 [Microbacterium resistens]|uniref:GIY-YIG domain-containing protein n=1 Tax=Microbacterium resistens TaxID=156977 RepID=A0ABU1SFX2_9MICO|nr:hypothetical protein [Microbacterium resistens]MDR6868500.1 hypothetical protein [Microbacterium resistens]
MRDGNILPTASWLYVWVDIAEKRVVYVGGTGHDRELRTFLHLTADASGPGRTSAASPAIEGRDVDVLAFRLPEDLPRPEAKRALQEAIAKLDHGVGEDVPIDTGTAVIESIVEAVRRHIEGLR